jgi:hypothetical protein
MLEGWGKILLGILALVVITIFIIIYIYVGLLN